MFSPSTPNAATFSWIVSILDLSVCKWTLVEIYLYHLIVASRQNGIRCLEMSTNDTKNTLRSVIRKWQPLCSYLAWSETHRGLSSLWCSSLECLPAMFCWSFTTCMQRKMDGPVLMMSCLTWKPCFCGSYKLSPWTLLNEDFL